jgi:hypothetical protein
MRKRNSQFSSDSLNHRVKSGKKKNQSTSTIGILGIVLLMFVIAVPVVMELVKSIFMPETPFAR